MKIGYPCLNLTVPCQNSQTFRLASYSKQRFLATVNNNLDCLLETLEYNREKGIMFFRITSGLIPFASHPVSRVNWPVVFRNKFKTTGRFIKKQGMRISMHPGHFTLLNSPRKIVHRRSIREIDYHVDVLDLLGLDNSHKVQIHVGGVYNDKEKSLRRFIEAYKVLPPKLKRRLVIENDEKSYSANDCLRINKATGIPVIFDVFHHQLNNQKEDVKKIVKKVFSTWQKKDGLPMVDYSSQAPDKKRGAHIMNIDLKDFNKFLKVIRALDCDIMLEIKNKEKSAIQALELIRKSSFAKKLC